MKVTYEYNGADTKRRIQMLSESRNETLTELEQACGIGHGTISRWGKGRVASSSAIAKIAQHYDVTTDYLLNLQTGVQRSYDLDKIFTMTGSVKLGGHTLTETQLNMLKQIATTIADST